MIARGAESGWTMLARSAADSDALLMPVPISEPDSAEIMEFGATKRPRCLKFPPGGKAGGEVMLSLVLGSEGPRDKAEPVGLKNWYELEKSRCAIQVPCGRRSCIDTVMRGGASSGRREGAG